MGLDDGGGSIGGLLEDDKVIAGTEFKLVDTVVIWGVLLCAKSEYISINCGTTLFGFRGCFTTPLLLFPATCVADAVELAAVALVSCDIEGDDDIFICDSDLFRLAVISNSSSTHDDADGFNCNALFFCFVDLVETLSPPLASFKSLDRSLPPFTTDADAVGDCLLL